MTSPHNVLVLAPVGVPSVTPGSIQVVAGCGHRTWASRNAQDALAHDPTLTTMCLSCLQSDPDAEEANYASLPGAAFEVSEHMGIPLDKVDDFIQSALDTLKAQRESGKK